MCADQLRASVAHHGERYGVIMMKKHYGNYLKGIRNGKQLRVALMEEVECNRFWKYWATSREEKIAVPAAG